MPSDPSARDYLKELSKVNRDICEVDKLLEASEAITRWLHKLSLQHRERYRELYRLQQIERSQHGNENQD